MDRTAVISKQHKAVNYNSCFDAVKLSIPVLFVVIVDDVVFFYCSVFSTLFRVFLTFFLLSFDNYFGGFVLIL